MLGVRPASSPHPICCLFPFGGRTSVLLFQVHRAGLAAKETSCIFLCCSLSQGIALCLSYWAGGKIENQPTEGPGEDRRSGASASITPLPPGGRDGHRLSSWHWAEPIWGTDAGEVKLLFSPLYMWLLSACSSRSTFTFSWFCLVLQGILSLISLLSPCLWRKERQGFLLCHDADSPHHVF